jgi:hypothetical protein
VVGPWEHECRADLSVVFAVAQAQISMLELGFDFFLHSISAMALAPARVAGVAMLAMVPADLAGLVDVGDLTRFVAERLIDLLRAYTDGERFRPSPPPAPPVVQDSGTNVGLLAGPILQYGWNYLGCFIGALLFLLPGFPCSLWALTWGWAAVRFMVRILRFLGARVCGILVFLACRPAPAANVAAEESDEPEAEQSPPMQNFTNTTDAPGPPPQVVYEVVMPRSQADVAGVERLPFLGAFQAVNFVSDIDLTPAQEAARRANRRGFNHREPDRVIQSGVYAGLPYAAAIADLGYLPYIENGRRPGMLALRAYIQFVAAHQRAVAAGSRA